jgi:hypothetical protein
MNALQTTTPEPPETVTSEAPCGRPEPMSPEDLEALKSRLLPERPKVLVIPLDGDRSFSILVFADRIEFSHRGSTVYEEVTFSRKEGDS